MTWSIARCRCAFRDNPTLPIVPHHQPSDGRCWCGCPEFRPTETKTTPNHERNPMIIAIIANPETGQAQVSVEPANQIVEARQILAGVIGMLDQQINKPRIILPDTVIPPGALNGNPPQ